MVVRRLTKKEEIVINSRIYYSLYRREIGKLYEDAREWLADRGIKEYDEVSGNGYKYHIESCHERDFEKVVGNTRVCIKGEPTEIYIVRRYFDGKNSYSAQGVKSFYLGNTDNIFVEALRVLESRDWKDLTDSEYFVE